MTYAFTIIITPEITRGDGCLYCGKCNTKLILAASTGQWNVDDEAFKSGEEKPDDCPNEVFVGEVTGHFCITCDALTSLSYNY